MRDRLAEIDEAFISSELLRRGLVVKPKHKIVALFQSDSMSYMWWGIIRSNVWDAMPMEDRYAFIVHEDEHDEQQNRDGRWRFLWRYYSSRRDLFNYELSAYVAQALAYARMGLDIRARRCRERFVRGMASWSYLKVETDTSVSGDSWDREFARRKGRANVPIRIRLHAIADPD